MAGTASASWDGEERDATPPWRRRVEMGKTTMEVGHEHMRCVRLHRAYRAHPASSQLGLMLQGRLGFDSWWGTDSEACQADSATVDLNSNGMDLGCQG